LFGNCIEWFQTNKHRFICIGVEWFYLLEHKIGNYVDRKIDVSTSTVATATPALYGICSAGQIATLDHHYAYMYWTQLKKKGIRPMNDQRNYINK